MSRGTLATVQSVSDKLSEMLGTLAGLAVLVMMGVVVGDVIFIATRLGSLVFRVELVEMMMIVVVFGAFAYAEVLNKHVAATMVVSKLSPKWRAVCDVFGYALSLFICLVFTWQVFLYAERMTGIRKTCLSSDLPYYPFTWFAVAGFILLDILYGLRIITSVKRIKPEE
jgi:TRAP-type C4-dicarboxylate transport system permease small subunit